MPAPTKQKSITNYTYPVIIFIAGIIIYTRLVYIEYLARPLDTPIKLSITILGHLLLLLTMWCYCVTYCSDPGKPPVFWGFYLDEPEEKRKRYCLVCHIFKPERCHHCSTCNRCVLNMDHHCPWLNTCIGFQNRKYFIMLLIYSMVLILLTILISIPHIVETVVKILDLKNYSVNFEFLF